MKYLDQTKKIADAVELRKPIVSFVPGWERTRIRLKLNAEVFLDTSQLTDVDKLLIAEARRHIRLELSLDAKTYKVIINHQGIEDGLYDTILYSAVRFIRDNGGYTNNRLSNLYKWYNKKINPTILGSYPDLATDLHNAVSFMQQGEGKEHFETTRALLRLIKARYESVIG